MCILKKTENFAVQPAYYIGENRQVTQCDGTYAEFNDRNSLKVCIKMTGTHSFKV